MEHTCQYSGVTFEVENDTSDHIHNYASVIAYLFKEAQQIQDKHVKYIIMGFLTDMAVNQDIDY